MKNPAPASDRPPRTHADRLLAVAMLVFAALSAYRASLAERALAAYLDCARCLVLPVLVQDLWLLALLPALFLLARAVNSRLFTWLPALAGGALAFAFVVDIVVYRLLTRRLLLPDIGRYGGEFASNWTVLRPWLATPEGAAVAIAGVALVGVTIAAIARAAAAPRRRRHLAWLAAAVACVATAAAHGPTWYLNRGAYQNVLMNNRGDGMDRPYGEATLRRLRDTPPPPQACERGPAAARDVIVLVVESWSMHHSRQFSGLADLTPRMDALARRGAWYPAFRANGFSTEGGLAALMTGYAPLSGIRYGTIMLFTDVTGDFHRRRRADGATVRFFTSGDLGFAMRQPWLRAIGIDDAEGAEHPAYAGRARGAFGAASDEVLLQRVLGWYDRERGDAPFVATVLTVGMHPPFVALDGAEPGQDGAVRATDAAVGRFVDGLEQRGFFDRGLLFVVGDHRVMAPVGRDEFARFGAESMWRVPAFALGATGLPAGPVKGDFQQVDLLPSLQYQLGGEACRSVLQGRMFGANPQPAAVQLYADPMRFDRIRVRVRGRDHVLVLDGDDSFWEGEAPAAEVDVALEVARLRIARDRPPEKKAEQK